MVETVQEKLLIEAKADLERALDTYWRLVVLHARGTAHFPPSDDGCHVSRNVPELGCLCGSCDTSEEGLIHSCPPPIDTPVR